MNFLIIGDSHKRRDNIDEAVRRCRPLDAILYLGDGADDFDDNYRYLDIPLFCVRGNCDVSATLSELPFESLLHFDEYTVMMTHGHLYDTAPLYFDKAVARAAELGADILLFGHTHYPLETYLETGTVVEGVTLKKPLHVFNPGSLGRLRTGLSPNYFFGTMQTTPSGVLFGHGKI